MYPRFAFAFLFSVCAVSLGFASPAFRAPECGPNMEYKSCGSACVSDCAHPEPYEICTLQCVMGCFCQEGYLKNSKGECVRPEQCDAKTHHDIPMAFPSVEQCPDNEEFHPCGTACPATCANKKPSGLCTRNCVIGCFCKPGYLRNSQGVCVREEQCEAVQAAMFFAYPPEVSQCKENEVFMPCGSACAPTCAKPHPGPACTLQCVIGCFCKPGFLKNEQGVCVPSEQCGVPAAEAMALPPAICGDNEEYRQCKGCDGTCAKPNPICPRICIPGCACKQGHLRDGNGRCMAAEQCPHVQAASFMMLPPNKCFGENEVFRTCGTACPATCDNPHPSPVCTKNCVIGCFCKEGYLKNANGACVPAANCEAPIAHIMESEPVQQCKSDREVFVNDCSGFQLDCMASCHSFPAYLIHGEPQYPAGCYAKICKPSCVCKKPYVRDNNGQCVETRECHRDNPLTTPAH